MTETRKSAESRYRMLDLLRGVAVFLMIAAHSVYFFHNDTSYFLSLIEKFGNTVAFTTFLIVSGATAYIAYFSKEDIWPERRKRLLKRIFVLTVGFFIIAFAVFFADIVSSHGLAKIGLVSDIITLRKLPPFAEFYLPFIVFPLIICIAPRFFRRITKSLAKTVILGLAVYLLGMLLYRVQLIDFLVPWKGLLVGADGYYRFPILQYFPVYLLGLVWGQLLLSLKNLKKQTQVAEAVMLSSGLGLVFIITPLVITGHPVSEAFKRWPPSIPFLLAGIFFAAVLALFFYLTNQLRKNHLTRDGLLVLGQNALGLALTHVFLLQIYSLSGGLRTGSIFLYIVGFITLLALSLALAAVIPFNFRFVLSLERNHYREEDIEKEALVKFEEEATEYLEADARKVRRFFFIGQFAKKADHRLVKKRHILGVALALALAAFLVLPPIAEEYQMQKKINTSVEWFDSNYGWRQNLAVKNDETLAELPKGKTIKFTLNLSQLAEEKKIYPDGRDLTVKYWDGKSNQPVQYSLSLSPSQASSSLLIQLKERVKPGATVNNYYLYYGNNLVKNNNQNKKITTALGLKYRFIESKEEPYPLLLTVDRRWSLLSDDPKIPKTLRISLSSDKDYSSGTAEYSLDETTINGKLDKTGEKQWEGVINVSELPAGEYRLKAKIEDQGVQYASSSTGFFVSEPLYIAWTQDWEGYDVPDVYLAAITQVARDHGLVMTHFWNPRLTTTETVADGRKETLLNWVKVRQSVFGESVQLHLHMFDDFVSESGVKPKSTPNWGDSGDGYGSLTTNYNTGELTKIIKKGMEIMAKSGFSPKIFRAGGWFANNQTLKAVEESGLLADSSGRTAYKFYSQTGPWNLLPTAQPYYPSAQDQNKSGADPLAILEIPNNGADSYWFSSGEMKKRFQENYPGGILKEPRQITYLSHPHWFSKNEQGKIQGLFNLIDNYKYENDSGPALYVTLDEIYKVWAK